MTVALNQTRVRPDDNLYDVVMIGVNFSSSRVIVRVKFQSGDEQDVIYEGAKLLALRQAVAQFGGLRLAMEQYLATTEPGLGGNAT